MSLNDAAYKGEIEQVKQFIAEGVDVNQAGEDSWTPLFNAAYSVSVD